MTPAEVRQALFAAAALRFPAGRDDAGGRLPSHLRIEQLEEHYVACAMTRQSLEEGALYMQEAVKRLEDEWDVIEGWQTLAGKGSTKAEIIAAKRTIKPEVYDGIREGKWLTDKAKTQVRRLERDEEAASRLYSMMGAG